MRTMTYCNFHAALLRGTTTYESRLLRALRSRNRRWYSCFTFRLWRNPHSYHLARPMSMSHCVQARPASQPPSGAFIVNFHAALRAAPPRMKARIAPCLRQSTLPLRSVLNKRRWRLAPRNPAPRYLSPAPTHLIAFIVNPQAASRHHCA